MKMKTGFLASAAVAAAILLAVPAAAAEYTTIILEKVVNRTPDQTWAKIGPYCSISQWMHFSCEITAGDGVAPGTNRRLGGINDEIIVAATSHSYTYTALSSTTLSHSTLAVEPLDGGRQAKIVYTLFYDQGPLGTDQAKAEARARRTKRFSDALDAMKALTESPQ
jgi:Polyketide cyclase / dehydrase and lipid transport